MKYISTRGQTKPIGFQETVMAGLASDGGLFLPASIPQIGNRLQTYSEYSYTELAFELFRLFSTDIAPDTLRNLINDSYAAFDDPEIVPCVEIGGLRILELFHGPTLAFKDIALQFLGNLFSHILARRGGRLNLLGATSGDTGSAAIYGVRGRPGINIFILHPAGRISPLQEKQMTSVLDDNVFNLAVNGTFDDCQEIVKTLFADADFKAKYALGAVNSINWARILAQTVYYFYSALQTIEQTGAESIRFSVPTGNFGDIFAGYLAQQIGLPIGKLILASNENDILVRLFNSGVYSRNKVIHTITPSMDIQTASNFERWLYFKVGQDAGKLASLMDGFQQCGSLTVEREKNGRFDDLFVAGSSDRAATLSTIQRYKDQFGYLLDPHTATGVRIAEQFRSADEPTVCLATAHPAKFPQAVCEAAGKAAHHPALDALADAETRCDSIAADADAVKQYLIERLR